MNAHRRALTASPVFLPFSRRIPQSALTFQPWGQIASRGDVLYRLSSPWVVDLAPVNWSELNFTEAFQGKVSTADIWAWGISHHNIFGFILPPRGGTQSRNVHAYNERTQLCFLVVCVECDDLSPTVCFQRWTSIMKRPFLFFIPVGWKKKNQQIPHFFIQKQQYLCAQGIERYAHTRTHTHTHTHTH